MQRSIKEYQQLVLTQSEAKTLMIDQLVDSIRFKLDNSGFPELAQEIEKLILSRGPKPDPMPLIGKSKTPRPDPIRILHLSDLHFNESNNPESRFSSLVSDIEDPQKWLESPKIDFLVVSGDLTDRATPKEFEQAQTLIAKVMEYFKIPKEKCIIVPGNHDLSWATRVYDWDHKTEDDLKNLPKDSYVKQGDGYLIRLDEQYPKRFDNFAAFYKGLLNEQFSTDDIKDQCLPYLFEEDGLQFLTLNSSWQIDRYFPKRASINSDALERGLTKASNQIRKAKSERKLSEEAEILRIAICHHPVRGKEQIEEDAFLDRLRQADFKLCLHGHVHEIRAEIIGYWDPRHIYIVGAGSFGASADALPDAMPQLYNVIEIERDHSQIRVHTRCKEKSSGPWEGYAKWPGPTNTEKRTYYDIILKNQEKDNRNP